MREDLVIQAALEAYGAIRHEGWLADRGLDHVLRVKRHLYSNERRAVAERVYALLRRQRTVDALLERTGASLAQRSTTEQDLLRLATSRVLHGESAERVARTSGLHPDEARLLEALPAAAAALQALPRPERFALDASLPDFLAARFLRQFGDRAEAEAAAMNERAPLTARVNPLKTTREALRERLRAEGVEARETPLSPLGLFLETRLNAFSLPSFRDGLFELQDEGSQLLGLLVDAPPTRVVDACAGAGGKTLQLAAQMRNRGELFALDVDARRLEELKRRARRAGVHNVRIRPLPASGPDVAPALADLMERADRVLVDAPCSGSGTFRRKPDARYRLTEAMLGQHVERQRLLLAQFAPLVRPGGRLVYGTCSVLQEENEGVVAWFLERHPEFRPVPPADRLGPELGARVSDGDFLRLSPGRHGTDGFFGAILLRGR
ncbi:MAG TPA: RsmB/NOP family class I SAM-dependent RNA methyltransferase [Myxococcaceae bacterium]|nr:RsmB/NOP family class I SAM-dependent RNA methyltransferase [Myxococcaceae bacterium]